MRVFFPRRTVLLPVLLVLITLSCDGGGPVEASPHGDDFLVGTEQGTLWLVRVDPANFQAEPILSPVEGFPFLSIDSRADSNGIGWVRRGAEGALVGIDVLRRIVVFDRPLEEILQGGSPEGIELGISTGAARLFTADGERIFLASAIAPSERRAEVDLGIVGVDVATGVTSFFPDFDMGRDGLAPDPRAPGQRLLVAGSRPRFTPEIGFLFVLEIETGEVVDSIQLTEAPGKNAGGILSVRAAPGASIAVVETFSEIVSVHLDPLREWERFAAGSTDAWSVGGDGTLVRAVGSDVILSAPGSPGAEIIPIPAAITGSIWSVVWKPEERTIYFTSGQSRGELLVRESESPAVEGFLHELSLESGEHRRVSIPGFMPRILFTRIPGRGIP